MINWNGKRRWVALVLLIAGIVVMLTVPPIIPVIQLPGEKYPGGGDGFRMTNSLMGSIVVWILLILLAIYVNRKMPKSGDEVPPGGFYNMFELLFEGLYGFIHNIVGEKYMRYIFSFFMTIFLIVLLSNWLELVPGVDSIGFLEPHTHDQCRYRRGRHMRRATRRSISGGHLRAQSEMPLGQPEEAATLTAEAARQPCCGGLPDRDGRVWLPEKFTSKCAEARCRRRSRSSGGGRRNSAIDATGRLKCIAPDAAEHAEAGSIRACPGWCCPSCARPRPT